MGARRARLWIYIRIQTLLKAPYAQPQRLHNPPVLWRYRWSQRLFRILLAASGVLFLAFHLGKLNPKHSLQVR